MTFISRSQSPQGRAVATGRRWRRWAAAATVLLAIKARAMLKEG